MEVVLTHKRLTVLLVSDRHRCNCLCAYALMHLCRIHTMFYYEGWYVNRLALLVPACCRVMSLVEYHGVDEICIQGGEMQYDGWDSQLGSEQCR